jgi:hypothetical protein
MTTHGLHGAAVERVYDELQAGKHLVPGHLWDGIVRHVIEGGKTGRFLQALFDNDLRGAVCRADDVSLPALRELALFMHNFTPSRCWGSPAEANRWREAGGIRGGAHLKPELAAP